MATVLGVDYSRVTVHARRLGGGFGGKELSPNLVALPAAVAAYKYVSFTQNISFM